jgi:tRNA (adenine22-N1)-methyltransferase
MVKSKRLEFLSELTKGYDKVIDIGSDHGLVLLEALKKGYIKEAIASDLREKPLKQAMKNLKDYQVKFILSDGFLSVKDHFDLAIISGMGANLICNIMEYAPKNNETYILQANDKIEILRKFLSINHFEIIDEYVIYDKFFYVFLKVVRGKMVLNEADLYLGHILKNKEESRRYYDHKLRQIDQIYEKADVKKRDFLNKMRKIYKNV